MFDVYPPQLRTNHGTRCLRAMTTMNGPIRTASAAALRLSSAQQEHDHDDDQNEEDETAAYVHGIPLLAPV
jgi:hypothetical protein